MVQEVSEKLKILPDEPTEEMIEAGAKMFEATLHSAADFKHHAYHVYAAMVDAAPKNEEFILAPLLLDDAQLAKIKVIPTDVMWATGPNPYGHALYKIVLAALGHPVPMVQYGVNKEGLPTYYPASAVKK